MRDRPLTRREVRDNVTLWLPDGCRLFPYKNWFGKETTFDIVEETTFEALWHLRVDSRWRTEEHHSIRLLPLYPKNEHLMPLILLKPDEDLACGWCGPRQRQRLVEEATRGLKSNDLFLTITWASDPKVLRAMSRYIARHEGRAVSIPTTGAKLTVSTVCPLWSPGRGTLECDPEALDAVLAWSTGLWVRGGGWGNLSAHPRNLLTSQRQKSSGQYRPGRMFGGREAFIALLTSRGIGHYASPSSIEVYASPDQLAEVIADHLENLLTDPNVNLDATQSEAS